MPTDLDGLPEETNPQATDLILVERPGVASKKMTWATLIDETGTVASDHILDPTAAHSASAISVPAGTVLTGANVGTQLAEADTALASQSTALTTHTGSATAHAAGSITHADGGQNHFLGENVQVAIAAGDAALDQAIDDLAAHTAAGEAHDASAIVFTPTGSIAATNVQAAIAEAASEGVTAVADHASDTTGVHGIVDTSDLLTGTGGVGVGQINAGGVASASTYLRGDGQWAAAGGGGGGDLLAANNLSDVANAATALANLGGLSDVDVSDINATGTPSSSTFLRGDGAWATVAGSGDMLAANNLSDVANAATARTNLGLAIGTNVQAYSAVLAATTASFTTADESKLDGIEAGADVTDAANVDAAGAVMNSDTSTAAMAFVINENNMASNSSTRVPTQSSVRAHVAAKTITVTLEKLASFPGTLVAGAVGLEVPFRRNATITNVYARVTTAPTGAAIRVDVHRNGTTIFTDQTARPNIAAGTKSDMSSVPAVTAITAGDYITVEVDAVGTTVAGAGLVVGVEYTEVFS